MNSFNVSQIVALVAAVVGGFLTYYVGNAQGLDHNLIVVLSGVNIALGILANQLQAIGKGSTNTDTPALAPGDGTVRRTTRKPRGGGFWKD